TGHERSILKGHHQLRRVNDVPVAHHVLFPDGLSSIGRTTHRQVGRTRLLELVRVAVVEDDQRPVGQHDGVPDSEAAVRLAGRTRLLCTDCAPSGHQRVFAGGERCDVSLNWTVELRRKGRSKKRRGRDSLTAYLVPIPECGNLSDYSRLRPIVNGRLGIDPLSWVKSNATKPPQTLRARATQR